MAQHDRVRLGTVQQVERHRRIRGMQQRALALDHVPVRRGSLPGESASAPPARKSATSASIGIPLPAIKMPVWPVARNVAATPFDCTRVSASAVYFLPSAQSVPTVRDADPCACVRCRRNCAWRIAHVDQPCPGPRGVHEPRQRRQSRVQAAHGVETRGERGFEIVLPVLRQQAPGRRHAHDDRTRALRGGFRWRQARQAEADLGRGLRPLPRPRPGRTSRAARRRFCNPDFQHHVAEVKQVGLAQDEHGCRSLRVG